VPARFQGAIFDVDGVLVDSPHYKAWQQSLRELMDGEWSGIRGQTTWSPGAFTPHIYQSEISGKPRMSGARAALEYFQVPEAGARAAQYAAHKQAMVVRLIEAGDFTAYPDAAVHDLRQGRRDPGGGSIVVQERQAVLAPDPARQFR
jgi:beta-phosphoglucomutase